MCSRLDHADADRATAFGGSQVKSTSSSTLKAGYVTVLRACFGVVSALTFVPFRSFLLPQDTTAEGEGQTTAGGLGTVEKKPLDFQGVTLTERWDANIGRTAQKVGGGGLFTFYMRSNC